MKAFFLAIVCFFPLFLFAQGNFSGLVVDAATKQPLSGVSVFLNNTSKGTITNAQGKFELIIPQGKYELIVSSVGYETYSQLILSTEPEILHIALKLKARELETVVVEPYEKDGWEKWGKFFIENFIGTSAFAKECKIKNTHVIRFRNSKKNHELTALAPEPLIIENKALGYTVKYQLETFSYNFKSHYLVYQGYPLFEPMKGSTARQKNWQQKRKEAYEGSMMHFMRSLYVNKMAQEGFEVRKLKKIENTEKQRVKAIYASNTKTVKINNSISISKTTGIEDSSDYYNKILRQPDVFDQIDKTLLIGDSISYAVNNTTAGLAFNDYLLINYKNKTAPAEYARMFPDNGTAMASQIVLINGHPVEIQANGSFYNPVDLISMGYWAWSEKLSTMLPFDYVVPKK